MRNKLKNTDILQYVLSYTVIFIVISVIVFCPFILNNISLVWDSDAAGQYAPNLYFLYQNIENLVNGNIDQAFAQYSFTSGLGGDVISHYGKGFWEYFFVIFGKEKIQGIISGLIILRTYEAGLSFSALAYYWKLEKVPIMIGSFIYAFSGYTLLYGLRHYSFLIAVVLLPLILLGAEKILRRENGWIFLLCMAYQAWTDFYFLYINTILVGVYIIIRWTDGRSKQVIVKDIFLMTRNYIWACLLSAPSLLVRVDRLLNSTRNGTSTVESGSLLFYGKEWLPEFFVRLISPYFTLDYTKYYMIYGISVVIVLGILGVWFNIKNNNTLKKAYIASTIFLLFPIFAYIFSGFNSLVNRWSYAYVLVLSFCVVVQLPQLIQKNDKILYAMVLVVVGYFIIIKNITQFDEKSSYLSLLLLSGLLFFYTIINYVEKIKIKPQTKYRMYLMYVMVNICINGLFIYSDRGYGFKNHFVKDSQLIAKYEDTSLAVGREICDQNFFRIDTDDCNQNTANVSKVYGKYGTHTYDSMLSREIIDYNARLKNNSQKTSGNFYGFDSRARLEALAGVKYYIASGTNLGSVPFGFSMYKECETYNGTTKSIYQSQYSMPLMYTYDSFITQNKASDIVDLELEHTMMKTAIVPNDYSMFISKVGEKIDKGIEAIAFEYEVDHGIKVDGEIINVEEANQSISLKYIPPPNCEIYLRMNGLNIDEVSPKSFSISINNTGGKQTKIWAFHSLDKYRTKYYQDYLVYLGYFEKQDTHMCTITFPKTGRYIIDNIMIQASNMDDFAKSVESLRKNALDNVIIGRDSISANMTITDNSLVCTVIPYSKYWSVYIDGVKSTGVNVNYLWLGFDMPKGTHSIKLKYVNWYFFIGCICSLFAICCMLLYWVIRKKRNDKNEFCDASLQEREDSCECFTRNYQENKRKINSVIK